MSFRSGALVTDSDRITLGTHPENQLDTAAELAERVNAFDRFGRHQRDGDQLCLFLAVDAF
jgi:hypothetical protein